MTEYTPDAWVVVRIRSAHGEKLDKVLGAWMGGYLGTDSWRLNSGITNATKDGEYYEFDGQSGSKYVCHEGAERANMMIGSVLARLEDAAVAEGVTVEVIPASSLIE